MSAAWRLEPLCDLSINHMRKEVTMSVKRVGPAMALILAGAFFSSAQAAPLSGVESTKRSMADFSDVEKTQVYVYGGRRYCYYFDAWNGPGWYRCGYDWREGYGWGGGPGWHGWSYRHRGRANSHRGGGRHESRRSRSGPSESRGRGGRDRGSIGRSGRSDGGRGASSGRSGGGAAALSGGGRSGGGGGRDGGGGRSR